jgi:hypothetical protein
MEARRKDKMHFLWGFSVGPADLPRTLKVPSVHEFLNSQNSQAQRLPTNRLKHQIHNDQLVYLFRQISPAIAPYSFH